MAAHRTRFSTVFMALIAITSVTVTAQTFQYSRGWTNGKRDGQKHTAVDMRDIANNLEKKLSPCQLVKLKYVLEGKPFNDKLYLPCEYIDDDDNQQPKKGYNRDKAQDSIYDVFL